MELTDFPAADENPADPVPPSPQGRRQLLPLGHMLNPETGMVTFHYQVRQPMSDGTVQVIGQTARHAKLADLDHSDLSVSVAGETIPAAKAIKAAARVANKVRVAQRDNTGPWAKGE